MLQLNLDGLQETSDWQEAGIALPSFDIHAMVERTQKKPTWVHFGAGNIFRAYVAALQQELLNQGKAETGIVAVSSYDTETLERIYRPHDNLVLQVLMHPDGRLERTVVASIAEALVADARNSSSDWNRIQHIFRQPSLQVVTFTITEKGYSLTGPSGQLLPEVVSDRLQGPDQPQHLMSKIAALAHVRYLAGGRPVAFVSLDNCSHNGDHLKSAVTAIASHWCGQGLVDSRFINYLRDRDSVSFPWTMIDKITPGPSRFVEAALTAQGLMGMDILSTHKGTMVAPFVNAEVPQYLVIEDHFPNGRMPLEQVGVRFATRDAVDKVERMKVTTCLNPLHTALAVFGCLLGYTSIAAEMKDESLRRLVERIGYGEGMPVVPDSGILNASDFLHEVIHTRLPNPYIPDTPQRIATDTSQKMPIRFGETIKAYMDSPELDVQVLHYIPLVIAGWCRYLMGVDDNGEAFKQSPDPMLGELSACVAGVELGNVSSAAGKLTPILQNERLFGANLYDARLGLRVESYFEEFILGKHAVKAALDRHLGESLVTA